MKRVKLKQDGPHNPLFEKWLLEWQEEAKKKGSESQYVFGKALKNLQRYPFLLQSGKECIIIENFGNKLCKMLDDKLATHKINSSTGFGNMLHDDISPVGKRKAVDKDTVRKEEEELSGSKKKCREYLPTVRSGGYAILLALLNKTIHGCKEFMTKKEIQEEAQDMCDTSFTKPQPGSHYTAWSSMAILLKKELVSRTGNPAKFKLTELGVNIALKLKCYINEVGTDSQSSVGSGRTESDDMCVLTENRTTSTSSTSLKNPSKPKRSKPNKNTTKSGLISNLSSPSKETTSIVPAVYVASSSKLSSGSSISSSLSSQSKHSQCLNSEDMTEVIFLMPSTFDIILLVDTQETDNAIRQNNDATIRKLRSFGVPFEVRHLKVGDFVWICRDRANASELVLPYIIERKRLDDFGNSIKDGRFHEQKFRLKQCGVENRIYMVEKYGSGVGQKLGLPLSTILQAACNTQVVDGFHMKFTSSHEDSMRYLMSMTHHLNTLFKDKTLVSCKKADLPKCNIADDLASLMTFKDFNQGAGKTRKFKVGEMLLKQLIQIKGLSVEKALAITQVYSTPRSLMTAVREPASEKAISSITHGALSRSVGPVLAKTICQLYTTDVLH